MDRPLRITARRAPVRYELLGEDAQSLGLYEVEGRWEGMLKLRGPSPDRHAVIITDPNEGKGGFMALFAQDLESPAPITVSVLKASPTFIAAALTKKEAKA